MKSILVGACLAIVLLSGCGDKKSEQKEEAKKVEEIQSQTKIKEVAENLKVSTNKAIDKAAVIVENIAEETSVVAAKVATQTKELSKEAVTKMKVMKKELDNKIVEVKKDYNTRGKEIFVKCSGCHGVDAKKKALNQSAVIRDWDKQKILNALKGYKAGTYGGGMKSLMASQVKDLTEEDIEAVASYITVL